MGRKNTNIPLYVGSKIIEGWTIEISDEVGLRQRCSDNNDIELSVRNIMQDFLKEIGNKFTEKSLEKTRKDKCGVATLTYKIVELHPNKRMILINVERN